MKQTYIDGRLETEWAMMQANRVFGFSTLDEIKSALHYDSDGVAMLQKGGLKIVGTKNPKAWAPLKVVWAGVGVLQREAALEYSQRYLKERAA